MQRVAAIPAMLVLLGLCFLNSATTLLAETNDRQDERPKSRSFRFHYGGTLDELPAGARVRVWLPVPQSGDHQTVQVLGQDLPVEGTTRVEPVYGNRILYFQTTGPASGNLTFSTSYLVRRYEVQRSDRAASQRPLNGEQRQRFLAANKKVPLTGKPLDLIQGLQFPGDSLAIGRTLYDRVDEHVRYDKSQPGYGNGDVLWVCDSRTGNCTDFHSLFISLARAKGLPARFEIGFPLPPQRGQGSISGYHCWAFFHSEQAGWVPVDISEADKQPHLKDYYFGNLTENRVAFSGGRDIDLVPPQDGEPLNYFVYPYVEVDGKPWPQEKTSLSFAYADVKEPPAPFGN